MGVACFSNNPLQVGNWLRHRMQTCSSAGLWCLDCADSVDEVRVSGVLWSARSVSTHSQCRWHGLRWPPKLNDSLIMECAESGLSGNLECAHAESTVDSTQGNRARMRSCCSRSSRSASKLIYLITSVSGHTRWLCDCVHVTWILVWHFTESGGVGQAWSQMQRRL